MYPPDDSILLTRSNLSEIIQASDEEIKSALDILHAIEIDGIVILLLYIKLLSNGS